MPVPKKYDIIQPSQNNSSGEIDLMNFRRIYFSEYIYLPDKIFEASFLQRSAEISTTGNSTI
jgi:hypothetical protein|tara:strand:- start:85 stop:270 length:186 start_codon:yes stop_codon:yes gene_type:complete